MCASCSDVLDRQWAGSTATDWLLVAFKGPEPPKIEDSTSRFSFWASVGEAFDEGRISREELEAWANSTDNWPLVYVYARTNYAQMKLHWAKCNPPDSLCIGPMTVDEFAENEEGVYPNPWPHGRDTVRGVPYIRPATPQEIARQIATGQIFELCAEPKTRTENRDRRRLIRFETGRKAPIARKCETRRQGAHGKGRRYELDRDCLARCAR